MRLQVEQVDLYQVHRPDILTHPQEIARALALEDMVAAGKVRAVGVSNYSSAKTIALIALLSIPLVSLQPEFFAACASSRSESGLLDLAMERDLAVLAWSPLGGGRIGDPQDDRGRAVTAALDVVAQEAGISRAAAAYGWIMAASSPA